MSWHVHLVSAQALRWRLGCLFVTHVPLADGDLLDVFAMLRANYTINVNVASSCLDPLSGYLLYSVSCLCTFFSVSTFVGRSGMQGNQIVHVLWLNRKFSVFGRFSRSKFVSSPVALSDQLWKN